MVQEERWTPHPAFKFEQTKWGKLHTAAGLATSLSRGKREKKKMRERLVKLGMLINIHELSSLLPFSKWQGCCQLYHRSLSRPLSKNIAEPCSVVPFSFLSIWLDIGFLLKDADWTESCPANDPGYQVLQVSLAFFPSPFFPRERFVASPYCRHWWNCLEWLSPKGASIGMWRGVRHSIFLKNPKIY